MADKVTLDVPLLIRLLEWAREDASNDAELHFMADVLIGLTKKRKKALSMSSYDEIMHMFDNQVDEYYRSNPLELMIINPRNDDIEPSEEVMNRYSEFYEGQDPPDIVEVETPTFDEAILIGRLIDLSYLCLPKQARNTEKKGDIPFRHKFEKPYPQVLCHPSGKALMILGGKFEVTDWFRG